MEADLPLWLVRRLLHHLSQYLDDTGDLLIVELDGLS
jgi:hypothetical protein